MKSSFIPTMHLLAVATFVIITNYFLSKILLGDSHLTGCKIIITGFCIDYLVLMVLQKKISPFEGLELLQYLNIFFSSWIMYFMFFLKDLVPYSNSTAKVILLREHNAIITLSTVFIILSNYLNKNKMNIYKQ